MKINITHLIASIGLFVLIASFVPQQQEPTLQEAFKQIKSLQGQVSNLKTSLTNQQEEFKQEITSLGNDITRNSLPVGSVVAYNKESYSIPSGWMLCDGSIVTDASSPLYNTKVPNLVSYFIRGKGKNETLLAKGGKDKISGHNHYVSSHKHTIDGHRHTFSTDYAFISASGSCPNGVACSTTGQPEYFLYSSSSSGFQSQTKHYHTGTTNSSSWQYTSEAGGGYTNTSSDETNIPEYIALNYIIKIK